MSQLGSSHVIIISFKCNHFSFKITVVMIHDKSLFKECLGDFPKSKTNPLFLIGRFLKFKGILFSFSNRNIS